MNNPLRDISVKYGVTQEQIPEILTGMKLKDTEKFSKPQLEGFERICILLKQGKPIDQAITTILIEARNSKAKKESQTDEKPLQASDATYSDTALDDFILQQAERAADAFLCTLPTIAIEERQRLKELFLQRWRHHLGVRIQSPEFREQFAIALETGDLGKLRILNGTTSNMALPSSSSSSS